MKAKCQLWKIFILHILIFYMCVLYFYTIYIYTIYSIFIYITYIFDILNIYLLCIFTNNFRRQKYSHFTIKSTELFLFSSFLCSIESNIILQIFYQLPWLLFCLLSKPNFLIFIQIFKMLFLPLKNHFFSHFFVSILLNSMSHHKFPWMGPALIVIYLRSFR